MCGWRLVLIGSRLGVFMVIWGVLVGSWLAVRSVVAIYFRACQLSEASRMAVPRSTPLSDAYCLT